MRKITVLFCSLIISSLLGACSPAGNLNDVPVPDLKTLTDISIEALTAPGSSSITLAPDTERILKVTGIFSDGSQSDITGTADWTVPDESIATIENDILKAHTEGVLAVSAVLGPVTGTASVTVTDGILTAIEVVPGTEELPLGLKKQYRALGTFSGSGGDNIQDITATVLWETSDGLIAEISDAGLSETLTAGDVTISASMDGITGEAALTVRDVTLVSIEVSPYTMDLPLGASEDLSATGIFSDASSIDLTDQVNWSVSDNEKVSIDSSQSLTALSKGSCTIFASLINDMGDTVTGIASAVVNDEELVSVELTASTGSIPMGLSGTVTATGTYTTGTSRNITEQMSWLSSDDTIAPVSNTNGSKGNITTAAEGEVIITAAIGDFEKTININITGEELQSIALTPSLAAVPKGLKRQMTAAGTYSNSTRDITALVTWASSENLTATVSNDIDTRGEVTTIVEGTVEISASLDGITEATNLTVTPEELVSIEITPGNSALLEDLIKQYTATGIFTGSSCDITSSVTWTSSNPDAAIISNDSGTRGVVTARSIGSSEISAAMNGITASTSLTITDSPVAQVQVIVHDVKIYTGYSGTCSAAAVCEDGTIHDVSEVASWSASDDTAANVSNAEGISGTVSAIKDGGTATVQVQASYGGTSGAGDVDIVGLEYLYFSNEPGSEYNFPEGTRDHVIQEDQDWQYYAHAHYGDDTNIEITSLGLWKANGHIGYYSDADAWMDPKYPGLCHGENETTWYSSEVKIRVEFSIKSKETSIWVW